MGAGEESAAAKSSKHAASTQETPTTPYPDWSSSMQAYYGAGATPPFFASPVASPSPHPYLWGSQHPLMPPYGTPIAYPALYPAGGIYAHPNMAMTPSTAQTNAESEGKAPEVKDRASSQKSKGASRNSGLPGGKAGEMGNGASGSGNDGATQSAESRSGGSSDSSDENTNQHEFASSKKGSFGQMLADANAQNNTAVATLQASVPGNPVVSVPATNLNIGMDLWNASKVGPNASGVSPAVAAATMIGREGMMPEHQWVQV
ncbi:unnamed protein product [Ilex paraguariensis]|uniref:G-box binding protein multifunctional mosaic region domain-containing protein n=1 Tax=Ilex paraguariensis TaxID=185542 RepID=A0ABC8R1V1_9AQUA